MIKVVTAEQMRGIDERTINEKKIPGLILMENAGSSVAAAVVEKFGEVFDLSVSVFAGKGNNGGDGFVAARRLVNMGADVTVFLVAEKKDMKGDAAVNMAAFEAMGGAIKEITEERHLNNFRIKFMHSAIMVDALLGTGLSSAPRGMSGRMIHVINEAGAYKVAVDVPSGMDSDRGQIPGDCVWADVTVTLGLPKVGLLTYPARARAGKLVIADISFPSIVVAESPCAAFLLEESDIRNRMPQRGVDSRKGSYGHLAMACGSVGMGGTAAMAGQAALRIGAGLVTAAAPEKMAGVYETSVPEMMSLPLPQTPGGAIAEEAAEIFIKFTEGKTAALLGPGLRTDQSTARFIRKVLVGTKIPLVLDADGLNMIASDISVISERKAPTILTPHPGEMARLTGKSIADIQADRLGEAEALAKATGAVVVLKGAGTIIAGPEGPPRINLTGNHGLAKGGSGDVLAGMIAGLLAQGTASTAAAEAAVWLHGRCADIYAEDHDPRTMLPMEIIGLIPRAVTALMK
ncbi:MAG: NAD(P)H-hydrate dehydratase [Nitrospinota bacterium]|nr:NAD(P)H-hydrate dehydratase [Nitrospinota bacterium]